MNILVLFCGGTLVMQKNDEGALITPGKNEAIEGLLGMEPRLHEYVDIEVEFIDNIDSTNMLP